jgi:curved DNA-binding protein CbpA
VTDPHQVLGVPPDATPEDIRCAYWDQVRTHPPERDPEAFKVIRAAYEQLIAPDMLDPLFRLQEPAAWPAGRVIAVIDAAFHPEDALVALQSWGDLAREDFEDDFCEVSL